MKDLNTEVTVTMTSREIAELTSKRHFDVMKDIERMYEQLKEDVQGCAQNFVHPQNGQQYQEYCLDREHTECLITGYSAELRMKVIRRVRELEKLSMTRPEPAASATLDIRAVPSSLLRQIADLMDENAALKAGTVTNPAGVDPVEGSLTEYARQRDAVYRFLRSYPEGGVSLGFIVDQLRHRAPFKKAGKPERAVKIRQVLQRMVDDGYLDSCSDTHGGAIRVH